MLVVSWINVCRVSKKGNGLGFKGLWYAFCIYDLVQAGRLQKLAVEKLPSCLCRLRIMTLSFCISCSLEVFLLCLMKVSYRAYKSVTVERILEFSLCMFCFFLGAFGWLKSLKYHV